MHPPKLQTDTQNSEERKDGLTVDDEVVAWMKMERSGKTAEEEQQIKVVLGVLSEISRELHQCVDASSGTDIFDGISMSLQDMWRLGEECYSEERLVRLLDLIATQVTRIVQSGLKQLKVWTDSYSHVENQLNWGIAMCKKMNELSLKCTKVLWPNFDPTWRKYTLEEYVPSPTVRYLSRLQELLRIRSVHRQITALVSVAECKTLNPKLAFGLFKGISVLNPDPHTDLAFEATVKAFEQALIPAEAKISVKLRGKLSGGLSDFQLMLEFKRYQELIERPKIAHDIHSQREQLLEVFKKTMENYRKGIEVEEYIDLGGTHSKEINQIYHIRQIYFKVKEIESLSERTLQDLADYSTLQEQMTTLCSGIEKLEKLIFREWTKTVKSSVIDEGLALDNGTPVIEFNDETRFMEVNYSTRLHALIEDVGQLTLLGFRLPEEIKGIVEKASLFVKQANELDQIASFHNTIGDRMIPCQRPMMLDTAIALSQLVSSQNNVSWSSLEEVEDYIGNFRSVVRCLSRQNNQLSQFHNEVKAKVDVLFGLDIVSDMNNWKITLGEIRKVFNDVEADGYRGLKSWKHHWDLQVYKAFEVAYVKGLHSIASKLPPIAVEIIYRQQKLQFKPAVEEAKSLYYTLIRKFLSLPQFFQGLSDGTNEDTIFGNISKIHAELFRDIYKRGATTVKSLIASKDKYEEWVALGSIDVTAACEQLLEGGEDWDLNFKVCRGNVLEIGRLPFSEDIIPPFRISSKMLRIDVESMNRKYFEALSETLLSRTHRELAQLETFLRDAVKILRIIPVTPDDICVAMSVRDELINSNGYLAKALFSIDNKNRALITWIKTQVDTNPIQRLLTNFQELMKEYHAVIGRQVETVRAQLENESITLENAVVRFKSQWDKLKGNYSESEGKFTELINFINERQSDWEEIKTYRENIVQVSMKLNIPAVIPDTVNEIEKEIALFEGIWKQLDAFDTELKKFETESWLTFRNSHFRFEEFLQKWLDELRPSEENPLVSNILSEIQSYQKIVPNLKYIRGDSFAEKHWTELYHILKMTPRPFSDLTLGDFLAVRNEIESHFKELKELNRKAAGEVTVRQALDELDSWEVEAQFTFVQHMDSQKKLVQIIYDFKGVLNKVGDNQSLLQSIKSSPFFSRFADQINSWEGKLVDLDLYLTSLSKIQRRWIYLEPVFSHGVLDNEQARFKRIDKDFRGILSSLVQENRVSAIHRIQGIRGLLSNMLEQLGRCQNSLNEFLETKRSGFPRFYFLGDDDLLEILGQSTKHNVIQSHLKKLFAGIYNVDFDDMLTHITAMKSQEGEVVELKRQVKIKPNVEEWLSELSQEMKTTLKALTLECISQKRSDERSPDIFPSQILTLCNSISFTGRCEESIRSNKLPVFKAELKAELDTYTGVTIHKDHPKPKVLELKLKDLILDLIHQIETVEYLMSQKITSVTDFAWQKQLRFYVKEDGDVSVKMADAEFSYSYEYQGNIPKLVHTPLTDKCYLTLTQGMRIGLGGNPFGPAGTGKTESVKALGALLGRQVLVFNCDEGIDVKAMGRIFIGLVKCGAWGCFDEFNRLDGATLSAVSMQIQPIQSALKYGEKTVRLLDETVPLDPNAGIFVTLNPAGKGYGGRNELPDNLKQLFRPVAMSSPNNDLISEVILYTEGFHSAKKLGNKLVEIFNLASGLLTPQKHYDWGLRALKTVLKGCGNTLRNFRERGVQAAGQDEVDIVVSALRLNTLPKLPYLDSVRFNSLIRDLFGDVVFKDLGHGDLEENVRASFAELKLHVNENQVRKCLHLYEQLEQRMGVVIVGPPCSGKSTICGILKHALIRMKTTVKTSTINPKAMLKSQLLGHINADTRQWSDGVLTLKAQEVYNEPEDVRSWIICDGDIDPEWVESLNSVLDDNRMLTLPSGWRIKFGPNVNFLFETHDLTYASPATVSRMGMILTSDEDADVNGVISSWLESQPVATRSKTAQLIQEYFFKALDWLNQSESSGHPLPIVSIVKNGLSHMSGVVTISQMSIAIVRGIGSHLGMEAKLQFIKAVLSWTNQRVEGSLQNLTYNQTQDRLECFDDDHVHDPTAGLKFSSPPLVKTANVKQTLAHIAPWMGNSESFLLAGTEGCGKTMIIEYAFGEMRDAEIATIHCSSLITPQHVLQKLSQVCISKSSGSGREYIAKNGGRLILYFKDLNLVKPDKWGTCQLVEFLQQVITHQGFYDTNLEWIWLRNVQIVASITIGNSDGRHKLSPRFTSNVRFCTVTPPLKDQLVVIYKTCLTLCFKSFHPSSEIGNGEAELGKIVQAMILVYEEVGKAFSRSKQSHYQFTSRDLTNWVFGLMRYDLETVETNPLDDFIQIWSHEACRLFRDRLVSADERSRFDEIVDAAIRRVWPSKENLKRQKGCFFISGYARLAASTLQSSTLSSSNPSTLSKVSSESFNLIVDKGMSQFGREYRNLNIVTFPEVLDNVAHFDRILSATCSSIVLVGRAGIGRRTALSIVAALHGATLYTLKVGQHYGVKQFKNDLKTAIRISALEGNKVFLIVEDFQLIDEVFLDMLNGLLSSGEVPSLYTPEELEAAMAGLRDFAEEEGYTSNLLLFFVKRIKELLHVVFVMDYTNNSFQNNCEQNPALYKQCSLLWLDAWSQESLRVIPKLIVSKFYADNLGATTSKDLKSKKEGFEGDEVMSFFRSVYSSVTSHMASPRRYIAFIHTYGILYTLKRTKIHDKIMELKAGVHKLDEAQAVVEKLKSDAASQEVILAAKKEQTNKNWKAIMLGMQTTNAQEIHVKELQAKTEAENEAMLTKKQSIDAELARIQPTLTEAQMSVGNLSNEALNEIRSLRAPPETIKDILEGVLCLMGIKDTSWTNMKSFLGRRGVKEDLRNFDAKKIKGSDRRAVEDLLKKRANSFDRENARRASHAAAPLAAWVIANVNYSQVLERIGPLMTQQAKLERNLDDAKDQIEELTQEKARVSEENERLKAQLEVTNKEVAELEVTLANVKKTLVSAEALVEKLRDEFIRWNKEASELATELETLPMKSILASAFITYLSDANEHERTSYVTSWVGLIKRETQFDFSDFMSTEQEVLSFQNLGLPSDRLSQENAIIITQTSLRPYLIDPSSRATKWLMAYLQNNGHPVVSISLLDPKFSHELELAVRFGKALIVHEMDEIDPILMPLLRGDFVSHGTRDTIQIGDKFVDYNQDFKLFMTTRNPAPVLPPDSAAGVTIVNFTTTRAGLTTQLLSTTLSFEKPELESRKSELLKQTDEIKRDLGKLSTQLLKDLAGATGNILENQELLNSLQQTKTKSNEINESLAQKKEIERTLNKEINVYLPLAEFGSVLFFSILDVPKLNRLYKFSLSSFIHLFRKTLGIRRGGKDSTEKRISYLQGALENLVYEYVCQSLFKGDRLAFALHMTHAMHPEYFEKQEWEAFVGQLSVGVSGMRMDGIPSWIPEDRQPAAAALSTLFPDFYRKLNIDNQVDWYSFMSSTDCENALPNGMEETLSQFQVLMTIQALRPDRLFTAMSNFARIALNRKSLFPPPTSFREILGDTMAKEPILILIASGADPSQELRELGEAAVGIQRYFEISMGKEEPEVVLDKIHAAAEAGNWLCLKNLHLVTHWLDSLEKEVQKLKPHPEFRLWLISEPHELFPIILAETCLKIAYESPEGLKKNMQRTYTNWSKDYVSGDKNLLRMQALFTLAFFHAIVQERRTYIPQGWSKFYEFNESDLRAGAEVLDNMFKGPRGKKIQWSYIRGIYENAIYGGRVDNEFDSRVLVSYLENYFNDDVLTGNGPHRQLLAPGIQLPLKDSYQEFITILEKFPDYDRPVMFGLPGNIERSWQRATSNLVINQLKTMARPFLEEGTFVPSFWSNEMNPILATWKKLNQTNNTTNFLTQKLTLPGIKDKELDPLENFVRLEQNNILAFLQAVHKCLGSISKICRGIMTPTPEMLEVFKSLSKREAPADWIKTWEGPQEAKAYLAGIVNKVVSIQKWVRLTEQDALLSEPLYLADLLHPVSFLSAFKQYCARKQNVCMDELGFVCFWKRQSQLGSKIPSVRLTGLYLEGCTFDGTSMAENTPESPHITKLPECTVAWVPQATIKQYQKGETISIPLYYNETRQKLVCCLDFPTEGPKSRWIQAGVGVFLKSL